MLPGMPNQPKGCVTPPGEAIVRARNEQYADAWMWTGKVMAALPREYVTQLLHGFPEAYLPWVTILCKLLRALGTPYNVDHWRDIAGYATLVVNHLDAHTGSKDVER